MKIEHGLCFASMAFTCLFFASIASAACSDAEDNASALCKYENFILLDEPSDRKKAIVMCSPEEQVDLYLRWSRETYPRNFDYERAIAKTGEPLIPALLSVLEKNDHPRDDIDKPWAFSVLETMQRKGYYDVAANSELMARLQLAISAVWNEPKRDWILEMMSQIQEQGRKSSASIVASEDLDPRPDFYYSLNAFGGDFSVPGYLRIVVGPSNDKSVRIGFFNTESVDPIKSISIVRNGKSIRAADSLMGVMESYSVNGFLVEILNTSGLNPAKSFITAIISRAGDSGQVIFDAGARNALDEMLGKSEVLE